jgi:hypothetical protein
MKKNAFFRWRNPVVALAFGVLAAPAFAQSSSGLNEYITEWSPTGPGIAYGFAALVKRTGGSQVPYTDFTIGGQFVAKNAPAVHQWVFGAAIEAWALPGSRSILVGVESAIINQEPGNTSPKVANNAVMKNRPDGTADPGAPMNAKTIAYWVSAQSGTGFERGLVFDRVSLLSVNERPVAIDLSDIPDEDIGQIDLIRIRKNVALRFDPVTRTLVLHVDDVAK